MSPYNKKRDYESVLAIHTEDYKEEEEEEE
jgi:hypothetical protein